jgi:hypothetical protein
MSSTNATSADAIASKNAFIIDIKEQLTLNSANETTKSFEGMKMRLKTVNTIAKIINKRLISVFDTMLALSASSSNGRFLSTIYLKMHEMMTDCLNCHRRDYLNEEKEILKVKDYALRLNKNARKCLDIVYGLMSKINNKSDIPSYDEIVSKHKAFKSNYWLRPRKPVNYIEDEDANFDDASDEDYVDENEVVEFNNVVGRPKRNIPRVDYTGMDTIEPESENDGITNIWYDNSIHYDDDYVNDNVEDDDEDDELDFCVDDDDDNSEYIVDYADDDADEQFVSDYFNDPDYVNAENVDNDDDSEYSPSDDEEADDDHVLEFDDDDYSDESEEDDDDYEDEDELRKEDLEFLMDYHNDSDYNEENNDDDNDDNDSEYIPNAEDELEDDHILHFDDDDYAEESEEDDDDYEDESDSVEDRQFVSDYFNDPDYNPDEDVEEEDELEYDFSFKKNANIVKNKKSNDLVLKAGIEEDEDYNPEDDEDDEDDEEVMYSCMNKNQNKVSVCKRLYDRKSGRVHYRWITMTKAEYDNKYDEDYVEEDA